MSHRRSSRERAGAAHAPDVPVRMRPRKWRLPYDGCSLVGGARDFGAAVRRRVNGPRRRALCDCQEGGVPVALAKAGAARLCWQLPRREPSATLGSFLRRPGEQICLETD